MDDAAAARLSARSACCTRFYNRNRDNQNRGAKRLLAAASVSVLAIAMPSLAQAQAVPAGCSPSPAVAGGTVNCIVAAPTEIDGISTTVDDLTINIGDASTPTTVRNAAGDGVNMSGAGAQTLNITNAGSSVIGTGDDGVDVTVTSGAGDLTIVSEGLISGFASGVEARNDGTGAINIDVDRVIGSIDRGIFAYNSAGAGTDISITTTGDVLGDFIGIEAHNTGSGAVNISVTNVTSYIFEGIKATNSAGGSDVNVTATGVVRGGNVGIDANNSGTGSTTINATSVYGSITGSQVGIAATSGSTLTGGISITATGVVEGARGIYASQSGLGGVSINANVVRGVVSTGIFVGAGYSSAGDISVTATGSVTGGVEGIYAINVGAGNVIMNVADVTGTLGRGLSARNEGGDLTINSSGVVSGGSDGVVAINFGAGSATSINVGSVTAGTGNGIYASHDAGATNLGITATGSVSGGASGIRAINRGPGSLAISTAGVAGGSGDGIHAVNTMHATDLSITSAGAVTGGGNGIYAYNLGAGGAMNINVASVTGTNGNGIRAFNDTSKTDLSITATGPVTGAVHGISITDVGSGEATVDVVDVTGATGAGISALIDFGGDITINVGGDVTGAMGGIIARSFSADKIIVNVNGAIDGGGGFGIVGDQIDFGETIVTINTGGSVTGAAGAISSIGVFADDVVTLYTGGVVTGDIMLSGGIDTFNAAGGTFTNVFGGADTDSVNFSGTGRTITNSGGAGDSLQEFEIFNFNAGGFDLTGTHVGLSETNFLSGANTLSGSLSATMVNIASGATLNAADGAMIAGMLTNDGVLNIGNSPGTFTINGDFVQTTNGFLEIEIGGSAPDLLIVTGDVTLAGALDVTLVGGFAPGAAPIPFIDGGTGLTGAFDSVNSGLLISHNVIIDAINFDVGLTTTLNTASSVAGLSQNQAAIGDYLVGLLGDPSLDPALVDLVGAVGLLPAVQALGDALDELQPEGLDMGLKFLTTSQGSFINQIMDQSGGGGKTAPVRIASLNGGPVSSGGKDGPAIWGGFEVFGLDQNAGAGNIGFDGEAYSFAAGISGIAAGPITFGIAGGYSDYSGESDGALGDSVDANIYRAALSARAGFELGDRDGDVTSVVSYAGGDSDLTMNLIDPVTSNAVVQTGGADINSFDWLTRVSVEAAGGRRWTLTPYVQGGVNIYHQDAVNIGMGTSTALAVAEIDNTRGNIGVGATFKHQWREHLALRASVTGTQYFGDTQNIFTSRFAVAPMGAASFQTAGKDVEQQVAFDVSAVYAHKSGFTISVGGFGEAGDINLYGGKISLSKRF